MLLASATVIAGCSGGPLALTCEEFLDLPGAEQEEIIAEWTEQDSLLEDGALRDVEASQNLPLMIDHCQSNPDHRLEDLESTYGFG